MKTAAFIPLPQWLALVLSVSAITFPSRLVAQAPAPAAIPDYSGGIAKFLQLGLPDVKDAKYINIENGYGFYDRSGILDDSEIKLTGNAWLLKDKGNGRVEVLVESLKVVELLEPKTYEAEQKKRMEARMKAMQKKATDQDEDEDEEDEESIMLNERIMGGKWKEADLKKDLATILEKLTKQKDEDEFSFRFSQSVGKTFLFAAHASQKGYKNEANQIIDLLFKKSGDNRKVLGRAMSELADAQYAAVYVDFTKAGDWAAYLKGMDALLAKYPAIWRDRPVVQKVADLVRKQQAASAPPEITGEGLTDEDRQLAKELGQYREGLRSQNNFSSLNWLITPAPKVQPKQKLDPLQRIAARGSKSIPLLAALLKDTHLVRLSGNDYNSYSYFSSSDDDAMTEEEINNRFENFSRPRTRGELAKAMLEELVSKQDERFDSRPDPDEIGKRAMAWYAKNKDKSPSELQRAFLAEGDENAQRTALWSLMNSKDANDQKAVEEYLLKPDKIAENISVVVNYASQQGVKAKPLIEKYLAKAKALTSLIPASRLEHADDRMRKVMEKQARDQLATLENLLSDKKAAALLDEYATSDRKWTSAEWNKVDDVLWSKLREESSDQVITLLLEASLKTKDDFFAWTMLQSVGRARYYASARGQDPTVRPPKLEPLKLEKHAELWKKVLQQKRELPAVYRVYGRDMPSYTETAGAIIESLYGDEASQQRNYQLSQTLGTKVFAVYLTRAEARLAGKELPPFPDKSRVTEARKAEIKKQLEDAGVETLGATLAKLSLDEQLTLADIVGADAKLNQKLAPGSHIITEVSFPANREGLKKLAESNKGKPLNRALLEGLVAEAQKLMPQKVAPMVQIRRAEPLGGVKLSISEPDLSEMNRYGYGGNRQQGMITAQLACMDSENRINSHAQWVVTLPAPAKAATEGKKKGDEDDLLAEASSSMNEHYAKTQTEFWKKLDELLEPKVNALAPYQVTLMCMLPGKEEE